MDAHYIAFSTDWEIDRLMSATVTYTYCSASATVSEFLWFPTGSDTNYGKEEVGYAYPTYEDKAEFSGTSWTGRKNSYSWDRIQTVAEFISTEPKLTDETKSNLTGKQWVLRFTETKRAQTKHEVLGYTKYKVDWTQIKKVSVLRLEFETDGNTYNLGAVSDAVSDDGHAGNVVQKSQKKAWYEKLLDILLWIVKLPVKFVKAILNLVKAIFNLDWWKILLFLLGVIFVIALIIAIFKFGVKSVFKGIACIFEKLFKALWWLICLPFRGIKDKRDTDK